MSSIIYGLPVKKNRSSAVLSFIDSSSRPGRMLLLKGSPVSDYSSSVLASIEFKKPCGVVNSAAELEFVQFDEAMVSSSGTAAWARIENGDGELVATMSVGINGSGAAISMSTVDLSAGAMIRVNIAKIIEP